MLNKLVIKNDPVKKVTPLFHFVKGIHLTHGQVIVLEGRTFHHKVLSKRYLNSNGKSHL